MTLVNSSPVLVVKPESPTMRSQLGYQNDNPGLAAQHVLALHKKKEARP